jgi:oxygen-dependent protoporphyrinogen oxidase
VRAFRRPGAPPVAPSPRRRLVAAAIAHPALAAEPVGSGVIVDAALPTAAKALTHITAKWDWARAATPDGIHLVRLSARDAAAGTLATADEVAREVSILTGVDVAAADVVDLVVQEWTDAVVGAAAPTTCPRASTWPGPPPPVPASPPSSRTPATSPHVSTARSRHPSRRPPSTPTRFPRSTA